MHSVRGGLDDRFSVIVPLGAGLGLRQGEILGLSIDDVDREDLVVNVQRQIRIVGRTLVFAPPKRGKTRTVPASAGLLAAIEDHDGRFPAVPVTLPWKEPEGEKVTARLLVTGEQGRLYSGDLFSKVVWQGAFRAAGVEYRKRADGMHALRHFYASVLLANGVSIVELADYLGHSDPGFTSGRTRTWSRRVMSGLGSPLMACWRGLRRLRAWRRPDLENRSNRRRYETRDPGHGVRNGLPWPGLFPQVT